MNFTHPPQTDEQKDALIQLNNIGTINALNTHNWELQQKVMVLNAENAKLREALKPFADFYVSSTYGDDETFNCLLMVGDLRAARKALGELDG